jgi:integrase/recombinase XerC
MAVTPTPDWQRAVDQFQAHLEEEERSGHTIRNYTDDLAFFAGWFRQRYGEEPQPDQLTKRDIVDWKQQVEARGGREGKEAALQTVNRKLAAIRAFLRWAQDQELAPHFDPPKPRKRQGKPKPRWLEPAEERALWAAVEASHNRRDIAIIGLGIHTGLRVSEMAGLLKSDITISERKGTLKVRHGKGNKEREIPLNADIRRILLDLGGGQWDRKDVPVLPGQRGPLKVRAIQDVVEKYGRRARVGKRVGLEHCSAHALRHTFGRRLAEKGVPLADIAELMGHSDPKTTLGYLTPRRENLAKAVELLAGGDD